jgi:heat shock protein HslJ
MFKLRFAYWLMPFLLLLAACVPSQPEAEAVVITRPSATATPSLPLQLDGTEWELVSINGRSPLANSRTTLSFNDGNAGGYAGCNNYGGAYTATAAGTITMPEIAMNQADCHEPEGIMAQESAFMAALWQVASYTLTADQLEIVTADGATTLTVAPFPQFNMNPADLIDTQWQLVSWGERELPDNHGITLIFDSGETMRGFAGCRHYEGSYFAENDDIRFPSMGMVEVICALSEETLILEGDFTTALSESSQYRWQEGQLELFTNPGERLLFVPLLSDTELPPDANQQPPAALLSTTWQLVGAGGEAEDMFLPNPNAWLRFTAVPDPNDNNGFGFEGFSGCNSLLGSYTLSADKIVMAVGQTKLACEADYMTFENFMMGILLNEPTFAFVDDANGRYLILQLPDDESKRLVFGVEATAVVPTLVPALYATVPAPATTIAAPAGLIVRDEVGAYWRVDNSGTAQPLPLSADFVSFNPSQTLAAYVPQPEHNSWWAELTVVDLRDETAVTHQLDVLSLAAIHSLAWLDETTIVLGVFDHPDDAGPNAGHLALVEALTGDLTILDSEYKMTTAPAVSNGRILYSVTRPDPILYQLQDGTLTQLSSEPFLDIGITTGDTSLFSPALATDGKQAWWGKFSNRGGGILLIYDPATDAVLETVAIASPRIGGFPYTAVFNETGSWLAFQAWAGDEAQAGVYLVKVDDGWTLHLGTNTSQPLWLDNDRVAYVSQSDTGSSIQVFSVANGQTATLMVQGVTAVSPVYMTAP